MHENHAETDLFGLTMALCERILLKLKNLTLRELIKVEGTRGYEIFKFGSLFWRVQWKFKITKSENWRFSHIFFLQYLNVSRSSKFNARVKILFPALCLKNVNIFMKKSFYIFIVNYWKSVFYGVLKFFENFVHFHSNVEMLFYHNRHFIHKLNL